MSSNRYQSLFRTLSLLRRLQRGSANKETLAASVQTDCDSDAYLDLRTKASQKQFENDMTRIRELGADYEHDRKSGEYKLLTFGEFSPLSFSDDELETLAFLSETFVPGAPKSEQVQGFIQHLLDTLTQQQQREVYGRQRRLTLDLRRRESSKIDDRVQQTIDKAVGERRLMRFQYQSPGQTDGVPRTHTVQPWNYLFDTTHGQYYLDAYRLQVEGPYGLWKKGQWQRYRPERIMVENLTVLSDKLPPTPPRRPRYRLEYKLAPEIARLGQITRHFDDTEIHEADSEGWVPVTAMTDDLFHATRILLGYGPGCQVTGDDDARREMEKMVGAMGEIYRQ